MSRSVRAGDTAAQAVIRHIYQMAEAADSPVQWWAGFFTSLVGAMVASIGPDATKVIGEVTQTIAKDVHAKHEQ